jgi:Kef-type K+ transport system membrane component KefB
MKFLAQFGIAFLLFMHGLNLNPKTLKEVGKTSLIVGLSQMIFLTTIAYFILIYMNFDKITSAYIALAISFSSTIIILKLLSDNDEESTLHGKISTGFLIVQDIIVIIVLMIISAISNQENLIIEVSKKLIFGTIMISLLFLASFTILPYFTKIISKTQELLLIFSIAWVMTISSLFYQLGFTIEIGALLAGISLSNSHFKYEINSKLKPLRDFFLLIFFIILGAQMNLTIAAKFIQPAIILSALVLIGSPLIIMSIMGIMNYRKRTSFLTGVLVSQISEFSFILISMGISKQQISSDITSLITLIGLITIAGSTYVISNSNSIYPRISSLISIFERKTIEKKEGKYYNSENYDIILFGHNRIGYSLIKEFKDIKSKFMIVDYNPEIILDLVSKGIECEYGDAEDIELLSRLPLSKTKMIISTIPDLQTNLLLINKIKQQNKEAIIMIVSHHIDEALELYENGASYVIFPHFIGGEFTADMIDKFKFNKEKYKEERTKNIKQLKDRKKEGYQNPIHHRG